MLGECLVKIVIAGGSGQVGRIIARFFHPPEHESVVLTRNPASVHPGRAVSWDGKNQDAWTNELEGADVIINLAGRSVNCRYHARNRREIMESRVNAVRAIGRALQDVTRPPSVWLQAATATIYAHRYDAPNDESSGVIGGDEASAPPTWRFSIDVAKAWENAVRESAPLPRTRVVIMRSAMIMSPDPGGVFATLRKLARLGLGGRSGDGRQFVSWIHEYDFLRALQVLIDEPLFEGPVNLCAPEPLPNNRFMRTLRHACGLPIGLPAPKWMLEIGTFFMRTETELILKSRRVVPQRLLDSGFKFQFPHWDEAAADLCRRYAARRNGQSATR
jgi:uncharacterized protein (TIGR01777 family)